MASCFSELSVPVVEFAAWTVTDYYLVQNPEGFSWHVSSATDLANLPERSLWQSPAASGGFGACLYRHFSPFGQFLEAYLRAVAVCTKRWPSRVVLKPAVRFGLRSDGYINKAYMLGLAF
ncbi:hypothetical protein EmuJ_001045400 [Echinococcus multilocularis]|uniref:Uncharacterized protein n=1 Tax=Echinococcus multilocularis TaxID=6211 RepID=A0A068YKE6_ECHMU|nr:hypothetical protein EmuJ_001045400 [Echinococcus multilocularis]